MIIKLFKFLIIIFTSNIYADDEFFRCNGTKQVYKLVNDHPSYEDTIKYSVDLFVNEMKKNKCKFSNKSIKCELNSDNINIDFVIFRNSGQILQTENIIGEKINKITKFIGICKKNNNF